MLVGGRGDGDVMTISKRVCHGFVEMEQHNG